MEAFRASAFTPFLRRFTDEAAREVTDTNQLYREVAELHRGSEFSKADAREAVVGAIWEHFSEYIPAALRGEFAVALDAILRLETTIFEFPAGVNISRPSLKEQVDFRRFLRAKQHFLSNQHRVLPYLLDCLSNIFGGIARLLPDALDPSPFVIPLIYTIPEPHLLVEQIYGTFCDPRYLEAGLFAQMYDRVYRNLCQASGLVPYSEHKKPFKHPTDTKLPLDELVDAYLAGTPFGDLLSAPVPLKFTHQERFSHMHIVGGSGAGKTTLLQALILNDLKECDPPSLVIVDSQGDLISKLSHLELFAPHTGRLSDRLVLISPKDTGNPPALNIFDVNRERFRHYDEAVKEQVTAGVIQTFDYLFAGLLGADLTAKQGVFFRFVARLMLALPESLGRNATILDMIQLMDDARPYRAAIESLPPIQRNFFERDFASKTFAQTKEQIRYRLNAILENPTLARLFTAPNTKIDLFEQINGGAIVLVDTAKDFLKGSSAHFGRIFISLVLQAVLERAVVREDERRPTFLIVDEAASYFDSNIDDLLTEARKYKCGCIFAHQFLDQATLSLRASLAANTSIKMAGGVSMGDARALAPDMRTTADFIVSQPRLHFAAHIRHVTPSAVSIPVPLGLLEREPRMDETAYARLRELNRTKVSIPQTRYPAASPSRPIRQTGQSTREPRVRPDSSFSTSNYDPSAVSEDW